jgi:hypothetical protein
VISISKNEWILKDFLLEISVSISDGAATKAAAGVKGDWVFGSRDLGATSIPLRSISVAPKSQSQQRRFT